LVQSTIGILDIYGFEVFESNSFEQFCINYANEKLQQFYNDFIFKAELQEYEKEGLSITLPYETNEVCIRLLEDKTNGIFATLDEQCVFPKATDVTFVDRVIAHHNGKNPKLVIPKRRQPTQFLIIHYAGEVSYNSHGWLEKNNDTIYGDFLHILATSPFSFLVRKSDLEAADQLEMSSPTKIEKKQPGSGIFERKGTNKRLWTVGGNFRDQLQSLLALLQSTSKFYYLLKNYCFVYFHLFYFHS